jgi:acid phosphatase type 7
MPQGLTRMQVAAIAGLALAPALCSPAKAAVENGRVAFSGKRGDARVIYTREANGTRVRVVPTGEGSAENPAFSPRGRRIAFTRYGPLGAQVWISYLDGTGLRQLTSGPTDGEPTWAPAGGAVAFASGVVGARDVYTIAADGSGLRRLTRRATDDHSPAWSMRNRLAFVRRSGRRNHVYLIRPSGGAARRITSWRSDDQDPAWSPTGRTLAISRGRPGHRDLYVISADGAHKRRLTRVRGDESEPAYSPDGTRVAFTYRRGKRRLVYIVKVKGRAIARLPRRSRRVRRLTTSRSASRLPSWQATGLDPIVAAAGDIACDPASPSFNGGLGVPGACRQRMSSDLLMRMDLSRILVLGDAQYEDGAMPKFEQSFDPSWGRLKPLMRPVPGNHEYDFPSASGYFDYFNGHGRQSGPAGDRGAGYYSFDLGGWHLIALNSECKHIGGCGEDSPQIRWLRSDLAAHPADCTLAYWHTPRFSSGGHGDEDNDGDGVGDMVPAWDLLYQAGAEVVLNGHEHFYERFAPQRPDGAYDPQLGIREFIVGVGGKSHFAFVSLVPNSEARLTGVGVLELELGDAHYGWKLLRAPDGRQADAGSEPCH